MRRIRQIGGTSRFVLSGASVLFVLPLLASSIGCSRSTSSGPVVLGHLNSSQSDDEINGVALAVEVINADPAKQPAGRKIKVIHADAGSTSEEAQGQAVRLLTIDKVEGLIGPSRWTQTERVALADQSPSIIVLTLDGYPGPSPNPAVFAVGISPNDQGKALARHAKETLKAAKAIIIKEADAVVPGLVARAFVEHFGGNPAEHTVKPGESLDFLAEIAGAKPDVVLLCGSAKQVSMWRSKVTGGALLFGGEEVELTALPLDGKPIFAAVSFHPDDATESVKLFARRYRDKHGKPPSALAALAYDALQIWSEAARRASSTQSDKIREQLAKKDASFEVLTGSVSFGTDQCAHRPIIVVNLCGDGPKFVARLAP
jgi:branched-chain amino acid transport system substrate-binding protein